MQQRVTDIASPAAAVGITRRSKAARTHARSSARRCLGGCDAGREVATSAGR